jgi:hypothetical protein
VPRSALLSSSLVLPALALLACGGAPEDAEARWQQPEPCAVTVCMNGAGGDRHPGNQVINALCADLPGKVEDCSEAPCSSSFASFDGSRVELAVEEALSAAADGCTLSLVGYSWGAVNAVAVSEALGARGVSVDRMVLVDPFSPVGPDPLIIPATVENTWLYRHSVAPADGCSNDRPLIGPYEGFSMVCDEATACVDYDYSLDERYTGIDHCEVPEVAFHAAFRNVTTGETDDDPALPAGERLGG